MHRWKFGLLDSRAHKCFWNAPPPPPPPGVHLTHIPQQLLGMQCSHNVRPSSGHPPCCNRTPRTHKTRCWQSRSLAGRRRSWNTAPSCMNGCCWWGDRCGPGILGNYLYHGVLTGVTPGSMSAACPGEGMGLAWDVARTTRWKTQCGGLMMMMMDDDDGWWWWMMDEDDDDDI